MKNLRDVALATLAFVAVTAGSVAAQDSSDSQTGEDGEEEIVVSDTLDDQAEQDEDADEVVCRRQAPTVGSRLGARRVCLTRREWQEIEDNTGRFLRGGSDSVGGDPNYPVGRGGG